MKNNLLLRLLSGLLAALLAGCTLPLKSELPVEQIYRLSPAVTTQTAQPVKAHIYLPQITVNPALDSRQIVLSTGNNRLDFIANSRWPDRLNNYLQAVMIEGLAMSGAFQSVSERMLGRKDTYRLLLRVADFQAELPASINVESSSSKQQQAIVVVTIEAFLLKVQNQQLVGQYRYVLRKPTGEMRTSRIVAAFEQALEEVLGRLTKDIRAVLP